MQLPSRSNRAIAVIAVDPDGRTYRIEQRRQLGADEDAPGAFLYCCLPEGQIVDHIAYGTYQLPDGTIVRTRRPRMA
ncbi:hypothetical protein [Achromobacter ruhlandii]|uniref:hypothetical protein n=1 Tax=Achromobacter ruhlandii TaxID=72557 RepID=UPI003B9DE40A